MFAQPARRFPITVIITVIAVIVVVIIDHTSCQGTGPDLTVCNPQDYIPYNGPALPQLPDQVTWRIEANFVNKKHTTDVHQFIDYTNNKMALRSYTSTQENVSIFKYDTNELIRLVIPNNPLVSGLSTTCSISPLSSSFMAQLLGEVDINNKTHVSKPLDGLRLNVAKPIRYLGKETNPDGTQSNVWEGCIYNPAGYSTYKITWWFADSHVWYSAMGYRDVPISMTVAGTSLDRTTQMMTPFDHRYNYADFRPYLSRGHVTSFQIPEGVYCQNEVNTLPVPKMPKYFTLKTEKLNGVTNYVSTIKEFYDSGLSLTKYEYTEAPNSQYGHNPLSIVHDFNTGVAYVMDKMHGNCSITTIDKVGYDVRMVNFTNVRLRTPQEFLDLDASYSYVGQRVDRGIPCDVWVTSRTDYPPPGGVYATTWEQYFSADVTEVVSDQSEFSVPVKLRISSANPPFLEIYNIYDFDERRTTFHDYDPPILEIYNFYDFDERRTTFHDYDVGMCFSPASKTDYVLVVAGSSNKKLIFQNVVTFKRLLVLSVTANAYVSPIRVTNIGVDYNDTGMLVTFTLLDKPGSGVKGDVAHPITEPSLDRAMFLLNTSMDTGDFTILLSDPGFGADGYKSLSVKSYSYFHASPLPPSTQGKRRKRSTSEDHITRVDIYDGSKGYTTGTVAGLAIGTLLGGFLIGFVIVFLILHFKRGRGPEGATSFDNPLKEQD